jgi:hypothetical protein
MAILGLAAQLSLLGMLVGVLEWLGIRTERPLLYRVLTTFAGATLLVPLWYFRTLVRFASSSRLPDNKLTRRVKKRPE